VSYFCAFVSKNQVKPSPQSQVEIFCSYLVDNNPRIIYISLTLRGEGRQPVTSGGWRGVRRPRVRPRQPGSRGPRGSALRAQRPVREELAGRFRLRERKTQARPEVEKDAAAKRREACASRGPQVRDARRAS
jgi:hypothetical protein